MQVRYYVLNANNRWQRVFRCGYDTFVFKSSKNIICCFDDYVLKTVIV